MEKKHYLIITLVLVTDVIAGFSLGSIVSYKHSSQQVAAVSKYTAAQTEKKKPASAPSSVAAVPGTEEVSAELPPTVVNNIGDQLNMTETEVSEVEKMLNVVGVPADKKYSQRIVDFQKNNNINTTGILDQQTLETLINQTTQRLADQRISISQ